MSISKVEAKADWGFPSPRGFIYCEISTEGNELESFGRGGSVFSPFEKRPHDSPTFGEGKTYTGQFHGMVSHMLKSMMNHTYREELGVGEVNGKSA